MELFDRTPDTRLELIDTDSYIIDRKHQLNRVINLLLISHIASHSKRTPVHIALQQGRDLLVKDRVLILSFIILLYTHTRTLIIDMYTRDAHLIFYLLSFPHHILLSNLSVGGPIRT